jgi:hypothetical protein
MVLAALGVATAARAQDPAQTGTPDSHQMPQGEGEYPRFRLAGFGDINFSRMQHAESPKNFSLGQFVLHMTSQLSSRVTFLGEVSFSARSDAGTGTPPAPGYNVEIERMILSFARAIDSACRSAGITRRSTTGTRRSITASGCRRPSAGPR